ncbi:MAG: hypothetical protein AAGB31_01080, partial [Bdellovibrio sp.]
VNCRSLASSGEETLPTNTVECEAKYGPGWFYENGACVPPVGMSCAQQKNKHGYQIYPAAMHGEVVTTSNGSISCELNCSCVYSYQCFNGAWKFIGMYTQGCVGSPH